MDNESIVEKIVRSLSFEVVAVPQDNIIQLTTTTKSAPLNVKIRVRKKDDAGFEHGVLSIPKSNHPDRIPERVRLVSSDQTIMSFNVVMEADFQKPFKKPRKNMFNIFKPTICLGTRTDEDNYAYLPSKSNKAKNNEESTSKSEETLTKNDTAILSNKNKYKDIFGKCKPGGCLDPPFGEDKCPYSPAHDNVQETPDQNKVKKGVELTAGQPIKDKVRKSSTLSKKLSNWKRKSSNNETLNKNIIKNDTKAESVLDLYQAESLQVSATYSHSIMTYPPTLNSCEKLQIQEEKQRGSRIYNNPSKNSINLNSGSYFIMPKKVKNVLDKNNTIQIQDEKNSDLKVTNSKTKLEDKITVALDQDLKDNSRKNSLQAKDSVTSIRAAKKYAPSDSKNRSGSIQKPLENLATLGIITAILTSTNTDRSESNNASLEKDVPSKNIQKYEDKLLTKIEPTESKNIISQKDKESIEPQNYEDTTKTERAESKTIPFVKDKESQEPQKYEDNSPAKTERTETKNILSEKNEESGEQHNYKDTTPTNTGRSKSKNIVSEKDNKKSKEPQNYEDTPLRKTEYTESRNILSEKEKESKEPEKYQDTTPTKTERTESKIILPEMDNEYKKSQKYYEGTNYTKIEHAESNNILLEKGELSQELQKYEDTPYIKTDRKESCNISLKKEELYNISDTMIEKQKTDQVENPEKINEYEYISENDSKLNDLTNIEDATENTAIINDDFLSPETSIENQKPSSINKTESSLSENDSKVNYTITAEDTTVNNVITKEEFPLVETPKDSQKPSLINKPSFDALKEIGDTVLSKIVEANKFEGKDTDTFNDEHKLSINDLSDAFAKKSDKNSILINDIINTDLGVEEFVKVPTPIERDTPLEIQFDGEESQYVRVKENHLEPEIQFYSENEPNEQRDSYNKNANLLPELKDFIQDKVNELIPNEFDALSQNENNKLQSADSQAGSNVNGSQFENIDQKEEKLEDSARSTYNPTGKTESWKLEHHMDAIESTKKLDDSDNAIFVQPSVKGIINKDVLQYDDGAKKNYVKNDEANQSRNIDEQNGKTDSSKEVTKSDTLKDSQLYENENGDLEKKAKKSSSFNEVDDKHIKLDDFRINEDSNKIYPNSEYSLDPNGDGNRFKAAPECFDNSFQDKHKQSNRTTRHKSRPIMINFATQSYVDENNQVIIKSLDADNIPKRYQYDNVVVTKRHVEINDEIHIPINSKNDMFIHIKNNKTKDINELDICYNDTDIGRTNVKAKKAEDELDQIERNVIIADDIRKTLVAVYEQELVPLRNTISELKDNLEMLTANHVVLKGHMFVRKPRSNKIVPLYKKCVCMKK